ncbi:hypothetical protein ACK3BE_17130 [Pseudomonas mandelii]|jgi:transposase InsO family protein|uniref:transposase n=1 Tax=Pseudomonas TaxID=286 RepID=UPI0003432415|nr:MULTISPECIES: transposase [unclassified Pseudomonas]EPA95331.1 transposase [Pseudomonas sp. G5(2012)]
MIKDAYSRKLVASEVHASESAEQPAQLLRQACLREWRAGQPLVLHSDNGSAIPAASGYLSRQLIYRNYRLGRHKSCHVELFTAVRKFPTIQNIYYTLV